MPNNDKTRNTNLGTKLTPVDEDSYTPTKNQYNKSETNLNKQHCIVHRLAQRHSFAYAVTWRRMNQFELRMSGGKTFSFVSERKISFISLVLKSIVLMFHYTQLENSSFLCFEFCVQSCVLPVSN